MPFFVSGRSPIDNNWTWVEGEENKAPFAFPAYDVAQQFAQALRQAHIENGPTATRIYEGTEEKPDTNLLDETEDENVKPGTVH